MWIIEWSSSEALRPMGLKPAEMWQIIGLTSPSSDMISQFLKSLEV